MMATNEESEVTYERLQAVEKEWDSNSDFWERWVGENGDYNRQHSSDPLVWSFLGDVTDQVVLDAGCGTGYLSLRLAMKGASRVHSVDISSKMIEHAKRRFKDRPQESVISCRQDSVTVLATVDDNSVDLVVSNYVLQDTPDLNGAAKAFSRVLKKGGRTVLVFLHPCFITSTQKRVLDGGMVVERTYLWTKAHPYLAHHHFVEHWAVAKGGGPMTVFHRPLSDYFKTFKNAGFTLLDFEEPKYVVKEEDIIPNSCIFHLQKN
eukprot:TRINITY_DN6857_c0_g1_i1.p1 TRINITY_DN6857_c0_g1~~TRINITY_DN6857_c0_g1_i1.p1  ORF type:complete len:263 (+),score=47.13 TRINITY_DN6857_c0_g1_i1:64-852(+)